MFYIEKALLHPPWESFSMLAIWKKIKNAMTKILHISTNLLGILWKVVCCKKCIILTPSAWSPFHSLIWSCFLFHFFFWFKNNEDSVTTNRHCVLKNEKWWQSMIESFATRATHWMQFLEQNFLFSGDWKSWLPAWEVDILVSPFLESSPQVLSSSSSVEAKWWFSSKYSGSKIHKFLIIISLFIST